MLSRFTGLIGFAGLRGRVGFAGALQCVFGVSGLGFRV